MQLLLCFHASDSLRSLFQVEEPSNGLATAACTECAAKMYPVEVADVVEDMIRGR
jgi:hypothetical protein